jgi:hypothetical protein
VAFVNIERGSIVQVRPPHSNFSRTGGRRKGSCKVREAIGAGPFADLLLQYQTIKGEIDAAIAAVIRDNAFIRGPYVDAFEGIRQRGGVQIEFGHGNSGRYGSVIANDSTNGSPYLLFNGQREPPATLTGAIFTSDLLGGFIFGTVANASADNQAYTKTGSLDTSGNFTLTGNATLVPAASVTSRHWSINIPGNKQHVTGFQIQG